MKPYIVHHNRDRVDGGLQLIRSLHKGMEHRDQAYHHSKQDNDARYRARHIGIHRESIRALQPTE